MTPEDAKALLSRFENETGVELGFRRTCSPLGGPGAGRRALAKFISAAIRAAVAEEREACAKAAEQAYPMGAGRLSERADRHCAVTIAAAIRARGK